VRISSSMKIHGYQVACLAPFVLFLCVFTALPIVRVFLISFSDPSGAGFTLSHFRTLFAQEDFLSAIMGAGLLLALVLSSKPRGAGFVKSLFMLPLAIPTIVSAVMMSYLFSTSGWVNRMLMDAGFVSAPVVWLEGGVKSLFTVMIADSWKVTPLVMLILLAGLQSIDRQLYRAARIDGAGSFCIFHRVTLPLLIPSITTALIIRGIDAFRIFSLALVLMGENMKVIGTYSYLEYTEYGNRYLSAASASVLFVIIMGAVVLTIAVAGRKGVQPA
jgi:trehalose transport system permease protein